MLYVFLTAVSIYIKVKPRISIKKSETTTLIPKHVHDINATSNFYHCVLHLSYFCMSIPVSGVKVNLDACKGFTKLESKLTN